MLLKSIILAAFVCLAVADDAPAVVQDSSVEDVDHSVGLFCQQYPSLNICQLPAVLHAALEELDLIVTGNDQMEKRKSAFVRFGKRKSAFVRFGRSGNDAAKRKSSYIRFG